MKVPQRDSKLSTNDMLTKKDNNDMLMKKDPFYPFA